MLPLRKLGQLALVLYTPVTVNGISTPLAGIPRFFAEAHTVPGGGLGGIGGGEGAIVTVLQLYHSLYELYSFADPVTVTMEPCDSPVLLHPDPYHPMKEKSEHTVQPYLHVVPQLQLVDGK